MNSAKASDIGIDLIDQVVVGWAGKEVGSSQLERSHGSTIGCCAIHKRPGCGACWNNIAVCGCVGESTICSNVDILAAWNFCVQGCATSCSGEEGGLCASWIVLRWIGWKECARTYVGNR